MVSNPDGEEEEEETSPKSTKNGLVPSKCLLRASPNRLRIAHYSPGVDIDNRFQKNPE